MALIVFPCETLACRSLSLSHTLHSAESIYPCLVHDTVTAVGFNNTYVKSVYSKYSRSSNYITFDFVRTRMINAHKILSGCVLFFCVRSFLLYIHFQEGERRKKTTEEFMYVRLCAVVAVAAASFLFLSSSFHLKRLSSYSISNVVCICCHDFQIKCLQLANVL